MPAVSPLIRSATLYGYVDLAESVGLDVDAMLGQAGLSRQMLGQPDHPIRFEAAQALLEASARRSGLEDFGLRLGGRRRLANLGMIGMVMREETTALAAIQTLCRYVHLANPTLRTDVETFGELVVIRETFALGSARSRRQSVETAVAVMHGILRELLGPDWRARRVCFTHRAPEGATLHPRLFDCPLEFDAEFDGLICGHQELARELPGRDQALARFTQALLDRSPGPGVAGAAANARQLILALLPQGRCCADEVARHLGMDRRTLHRRLYAESSSFQRLLQEVRDELAARHVRDGSRSLTEVADLMGFASVSALSHWFRKRHGCAPSDWRTRRPDRGGGPPA
jgi:AraC-like DNA-binding protein